MRIVLALVTAALLMGSCATPAGRSADIKASGTPIGQVAASVAPSTPPVSQPATAAACAGLAPTQLAPGFSSRFPARTAIDVLSGAAADPYLRIDFEELSGVRPGPRDVRVPLCRLDLLRLGDPKFVRQHPSTTGIWLLPIVYDGVILRSVLVPLAPDGTGTIGGSRGGDPVGGEAAARRAGDVPGDPVVSAELVYAAPPGCAPRDTISWRLARRSGTVVYFVPDFPGGPPRGAVFREDEMRFMSRTSEVPGPSEFRIAPSIKLASAC